MFHTRDHCSRTAWEGIRQDSLQVSNYVTMLKSLTMSLSRELNIYKQVCSEYQTIYYAPNIDRAAWKILDEYKNI